MQRVLRKKRFWVVVILVLIGSVIFDLVVLNVWAINSIRSGQWDERLLFAGGLLLASDVAASTSNYWKIRSAGFSRLFFLVIVVLAMSIHGFWNGVVFSSLILILSRLLRVSVWLIKKGIRRFRRRGLLEEI